MQLYALLKHVQTVCSQLPCTDSVALLTNGLNSYHFIYQNEEPNVTPALTFAVAQILCHVCHRGSGSSAWIHLKRIKLFSPVSERVRSGH